MRTDSKTSRRSSVSRGSRRSEALLALPDATLRGLHESYVDALSEPVRSAIRARLAR